jgi:hypothetical protein
MAKILVLMMSGKADDARETGLRALREAGHAVKLVEPRFPECKAEVQAAEVDVVVVDASRSLSHGRATAGWMATQARFRTTPFLFVDVAHRDMARVTRELQRAQFGTWASVVGASERLAKR